MNLLNVVTSPRNNSTGTRWGFFFRQSDGQEVGQWTCTNFRSVPYGCATKEERAEMSWFVNTLRSQSAIKRKEPVR